MALLPSSSASACPRSSSTSAMVTWAPSLTKWRGVSRPVPPDAPLTIVILPSSLPMCAHRSHTFSAHAIRGSMSAMVMSMSRFNLVLPGLDPPTLSEMYRASLDMVEYMDKNGFAMVTLEEHHGADNGWMPSTL